MSSLVYQIPTLNELRTKVQEVFHRRPCDFQLRAALTLLQRRDLILIAPTGSGKTLPFWMPLLFNNSGITVVITALNVLGAQNQRDLEAAGIKASVVTAENATNEFFKEAATGTHRVLVVHPERAKTDPRFQALWRTHSFASRLFNIIIDEAHCVNEWGTSFRPEYGKLGELQWMVPPGTPFAAASATLTPKGIGNLQRSLNMRPERTEVIQLSNDRSNLALQVRRMKHPANSFFDLAFLIPFGLTVDSPPPRTFLAFANKRRISEGMVKYLWSRMAPEVRHKVVWLHAGMTEEFKEQTIAKLKRREIWGICCTDAAGMGLDLSNIEVVVQYLVPPSLSTLVQRIGRGGRDPSMQAFGILLAEPKYFDDVKVAAAARALARKKKRRKKGAGTSVSKRAAVDVGGAPTPVTPRSEPVATEGASSTEDSNPSSAESDASAEDVQQHATPALGPKTRTGQRVHGVKSQKNQQPKIVEVEMLDFINAENRSMKCRRRVINAYYGNDFLPRELSDCCERCEARRAIPRVCCDLCHPEAFCMDGSEGVPARKRRKRKTKLVPTEPEAQDLLLTTALETWRERAFNEVFGDDETHWGPRMIMGNELLQRIVGLAKLLKLPDMPALESQIEWGYMAMHGSTILTLVHAHRPHHTAAKTPMSTGPLQPRSLNPETPMQKGGRSCSACGALGHIRSNRFCPKNHKYVRPAEAGLSGSAAVNLSRGQENIQPPPVAVPISATPSWQRVLQTPGEHRGLYALPTYLASPSPWGRQGVLPGTGTPVRFAPMSPLAFYSHGNVSDTHSNLR